MTSTSISVEPELLKEIDKFIELRIFRNRTHFFSHVGWRFVEDTEVQKRVVGYDMKTIKK